MGVDPTVVRLLVLIASLIHIPTSMLAYLAACLIVPEKEVVEAGTEAGATRLSRIKVSTTAGIVLVLGVLLTLLGVALLLEHARKAIVELVELLRWVSIGLVQQRAVIGVVLLVIGVVLVVLSMRKSLTHPNTKNVE